MKLCGGCGDFKPVEEFNRNRNKRDGLQTACKLCDQEASRRYYKANRKHHIAVVGKRRDAQVARNRQLVIDFLRQHSCVDCGFADIRALDFDHVRGVKLDSVCQMVTTPVSESKLRAEIAKCEVRCANCHRIRTSDTLNFYRSGVG